MLSVDVGIFDTRMRYKSTSAGMRTAQSVWRILQIGFHVSGSLTGGWS